MNLQEELEVLKERIAELENQVEQEKEFPQFGDDYWYVDSDTDVLDVAWYGGEYDQGRLSINNVFKTKDQAEFVAEKLRVEAELRKFGRMFILGEENWYLNMIRSKDITIAYDHYNIHQGTVYFKSKDKVKEVIETIGEERIKKYIFGVED